MRIELISLLTNPARVGPLLERSPEQYYLHLYVQTVMYMNQPLLVVPKVNYLSDCLLHGIFWVGSV